MQTERMRRLALGLAAVSWAAGCSSARYLYHPEENATARVAGRPAAYYAIPSQSPRGEVRLAVLGIAKLEPRGRAGGQGAASDSDAEPIPAVHVRMVVDNNDDTAAWQVDTRQQVGSLDHYGKSRPALASLSAGHPPIASIAAGASETLDLYYPLPAAMQSASEVPHFELLWHVQTAEAPVTERTTFERVRIEEPPPAGYYACGVQAPGPGWYGWYDPFWPNYAFWGAPARPPVYGAPPARPPVRTRR
jgi:hypothetical protein